MNSREQKGKLLRNLFYCAIALLFIGLISEWELFVSAQSIGYQPQFNFGFNPYFSPVFGYGLGLPFGANSLSPTRYPWLLSSIPDAPIADKSGVMSKLHAKAFLTKLATSQIVSPGYYGIKDKLNLIKYPEAAYTPFGAGYGYGKHYGSALVPNNPYKSVYSDYYDYQQNGVANTGLVNSAKPHSLPIGGKLVESSTVLNAPKPYGHYLKPLIKVGALITTAAVLGKKIFAVPAKLHPSGMIINGVRS